MYIHERMYICHERKENIPIDNWTDFLWQDKISELYIRDNVMIMLM